MSNSTFTEMVCGYGDDVDNIDYQILKIDEQVSTLNQQMRDIIKYVLTPMKNDSDTYLTSKAAGFGGTTSVCTSGSYGLTDENGNLTEWAIVSGGSCNEEDLGSEDILWTPDDISGGGPTQADIDQNTRQNNYWQVIDHLHREFTDSPTATYGVSASKYNLQLGKDILERNKTKYNLVKTIYSDYLI